MCFRRLEGVIEMSSTLAGIAIAVIAGMFVLYQANASLDFYGSIGFDMFDKKDKPFSGHDNHNNDDEIDVVVDLGKSHSKSKQGYPDVEIKSGDNEEYIFGNDFRDDGKGKVSLEVDDDSDRVCIDVHDVDYTECKKIGSKDKITFDLKGDN